MAAIKNQPGEMQQMTDYLKEEIKNQTKEMQKMTKDLKDEIEATSVNQTVGM